MDDNGPGIWDGIPQRLPPGERQALAQLGWEEAMVSRILRLYGREALTAPIRRACEEKTGHYRLLFLWFADRFPDFPVWLVFRKVRYLHKLTMEDFLKRFSKTPIFDAWLEAQEVVPEAWQEEERPVGLVFEYLHGMGAAILTDCERLLGEDNTRIVKNFRGKNLYLEPLDQFLEALAWQPVD